MSSKTLSHYPIIAALLAAEKLLGPKTIWLPSSGSVEQQEFLRLHYNYCREEAGNLNCIESMADFSVDAVNKFLADRGFSIKLEKMGSFRDIYAAAILDVLLRWCNQGKTGKIRGIDFKSYDAFSLDTDYRSGVAIFDCVEMLHTPSFGGKCPLAIHIQIKTSNGDLVNLLVDMPLNESLPVRHFCGLENPIIEGILRLIIDSGSNNDMFSRVKSASYKQLTLPMVSLDQENDISWLCGMGTESEAGKDYVIAQAFQQNKLKINEVGVRAQSAVAVGIMRTCVSAPSTELIVNSPFFMWLERPGLKRPIFAAYLDFDSWSNPGLLEG